MNLKSAGENAVRDFVHVGAVQVKFMKLMIMKHTNRLFFFFRPNNFFNGKVFCRENIN